MHCVVQPWITEPNCHVRQNGCKLPMKEWNSPQSVLAHITILLLLNWLIYFNVFHSLVSPEWPQDERVGPSPHGSSSVRQPSGAAAPAAAAAPSDSPPTPDRHEWTSCRRVKLMAGPCRRRPLLSCTPFVWWRGSGGEQCGSRVSSWHGACTSAGWWPPPHSPALWTFTKGREKWAKDKRCLLDRRSGCRAAVLTSRPLPLWPLFCEAERGCRTALTQAIGCWRRTRSRNSSGTWWGRHPPGTGHRSLWPLGCYCTTWQRHRRKVQENWTQSFNSHLPQQGYGSSVHSMTAWNLTNCIFNVQ